MYTLYEFISPYSFLMAILWSSLFIVASILLHKMKVAFKYSLFPISFLLMLSIVRMFVTVEIPGAIIVPTTNAYADALNFFTRPLLKTPLLGVSITIIQICITLWVVVGVYLLVRYACRYLKNQKILQSLGVTRDFDAEKLLQSAANRKIRKLKIYRTAKINVPILTGIAKPAIYLPDIDFPEEELKGILLHEYTHYKNKDLLLMAIVDAMCILFWWNPLVYLLRKNVSLVQELATDFAVTTHMSHNEMAHYLRSMVRISDTIEQSEKEMDKVASVTKPQVSIAASFMDDAAELPTRLAAMRVYKKSRKNKAIVNIAFCTFMALTFIISYIFVLQPKGTRYREMYPIEHETEVYEVGEGNDYLLKHKDGSYSFYINGKCIGKYKDEEQYIKYFPIIEE